MDLLLFHNEKWQKLYNNCSQIDSAPLPWEHRRHVPESIFFIALCTLYYILYIPCIYSFLRNLRDEKGPNACYQIMLYISITDLGALWILGFYATFQFLSGTVYCSNPVANYLTGKLAQSLVMSEIAADSVLALNRCVDILSPSHAAMLFRGKRLWFWLIPCTINGLYSLFFVRPVVYNGFTLALTNNPYLGFWMDDINFPNPLHLTINEYFLTFSTPSIYFLFLMALIIKTNAYRSESSKISKVQRSAFYQVFLISLFNMFAGVLYYSKEVFPTIISPQFIFIAQFSWIQIHGIPAVIYLIFNQTVRNDIRMLYMKMFKSHRVGHIHGVTVLLPSHPFTQQIINSAATGGSKGENNAKM